MADTIDSISIELTASTESAENSIQRVIDMLRMLKAATIDASAESRIVKSIRSIAKAAKEVDTDAGQKLARLAGGLKALSKVGDLSNLADAGKNLSSVVRAVNSIGQAGWKGLSNLANGIKQTSDALGGIKDADVSKLGAVRDALSGEMSGSLHQANQNVIEHPALGGSVARNYDLGLVNPAAVSIYERIAYAIHEATAAYREFRSEVGSGGGIAGLLGEGPTGGAMTVTDMADSIRDAASAYQEFEANFQDTGHFRNEYWPDDEREPFPFTGEATAAFREMIQEMEKTADFRNMDMGEPFRNLADDAAQASEAVKMLTGGVGGGQEGPWVADEIRDAARAYDDVGNSASATAQVIETEFVNPTGAAFSRLNNIIWSVGNSISQIGSGFSGVGSMLGMVGQTASTVGSGFMQFTGIAGFAKDILFGIGNDADTASKKMGGLAKMAQNVGGAFSRYGFAAIPKYFGGQLIGNIQKATKGLTGFFHSIVRIAKYRLIRTALRMITQGINEGIKNLYAFSQAASGTFASSMNQIATASKYLGNSFAAMASPLVEALAPAIDFIVDKFVDMFNTISQIIARLTGKSTYTVAKKVASSWGDAAKSASSGAKDAADEIKRTIMGFDEINKLSKESSSSGGGGGGGGSGGGASSMFEEMPIDGAVSSFADSLKAAFEEGNWQELGTILGTKVNELVDSIDFAGAGKKVGYYINAWFSTKYWTLDTINFTNIGSKIAEFLNNAIKEIHFDIIGASLVQKLTIIGDLIIGFFTDFDWGQAATSFSDFVKGIFNEISKWLDKHDWGDVGRTIYEKLEDALTNLDLSGIATSFATALGKAIKAVVSAGAGFLAGFWADVTAYWDEHIKAEDFTTTVHNILDAIGQGFSNLGEWVWNSIIKPFGAALTGNENWDTELLDVGKNIIEGIFNGIKNVISGVGTWIKTNIFDPFLKWLKSVFGIASPATTMEEPGENIVLGIFQGIINALANVGQWVKENIFEPIWGAIKEAGTTAIDIAVSLVQNVGEWATDIWNFLQNTGATIAKKIEAAFDAGKSFVGDVWNFIKTGAENIAKTVTAGFEAAKSFAGDVWDFIKGTGETIKKTVKAAFDAGNSFAGDVWNFLKDTGATIKKTVSLIAGSIADFAGGIWDFVLDAKETVFKKISLMAGSIADFAGGIWDFVLDTKETVAKTIQLGMDKAASWIDSIVDFILGPESSNKKANIAMAIENTALAIVNFLRDPVTAIKNVMLELGVKFAQGVEKFWNWITGQDGQSEVVFDAYGNMMIVPKAGTGLTDNGGGNFSLTNPVSGTTVLTPDTGKIDALAQTPVTFTATLSPKPASGSSTVQGIFGESFDVKSKLIGAVSVKNGAKKLSEVQDTEFDVKSKLTGAVSAKDGAKKLSEVQDTEFDVKSKLTGAVSTKDGAKKLSEVQDTVFSVRSKLIGKAKGSLNLSSDKNNGVFPSSFDVKANAKAGWTGTVQHALGVDNLKTDLEVNLKKGSNDTIEITQSGNGGGGGGTWRLAVRELGGAFVNGIWKSISQFANGGIFSGGFWKSIPQYAGGTTNAHGSMFLAGEAGPELVGHVGGRTEVLNQSQLAATMFSAVRAAMGGVKIAATMYDGGGDSDEADYEMMYRAMYDAFTDAMAGSNERDREKVALMRQIAAKEFTTEVTANSVNRAQTRMNRRAGATIVPVGT